jgi:hypothetical protein
MSDDDFVVGNLDFSEEDPEPPKKRGRGRPLGVKNKKGFLKLIDRNYDKLESMLNDKQKEYLRLAFQGLQEYDPLIQAEIFMILYQLYITDVMDKAMNYVDKDGNPSVLITQDIAQTLGQYRMGLKDVEDMKQRREDKKAKASDKDGLVDPTRKSSLPVLESILKESP